VFEKLDTIEIDMSSFPNVEFFRITVRAHTCTPSKHVNVWHRDQLPTQPLSTLALTAGQYLLAWDGAEYCVNATSLNIAHVVAGHCAPVADDRRGEGA
jgi:hypothetical protein